MEIAFDEEALKDLKFWKQFGNTIMQKKITKLLDAITTDPFKGIGKPEALKHQLSGRQKISYKFILSEDITPANKECSRKKHIPFYSIQPKIYNNSYEIMLISTFLGTNI